MVELVQLNGHTRKQLAGFLLSNGSLHFPGAAVSSKDQHLGTHNTLLLAFPEQLAFRDGETCFPWHTFVHCGVGSRRLFTLKLELSQACVATRM